MKRRSSGRSPQNKPAARPKDTGSRQQSVPEQNSQSGSQEPDEDARKRGDGAVPVIPAGAK